jgi:chromosomal replication initiation ATPase DnaA
MSLSPRGRQLALPLPAPAASYDPAELLADDSNAEARAWLERPGGWPFGRLALYGPAKSGKTHLLRWAAARHPGWALLEGGGPALRGLPRPPAGAAGLVLDDADMAAEEAALFHLINLCMERGQALLLAGEAPPARWPVRLPDLRSRLRGTTAVAVGPPGDALLAALLAKHFAERQLRVDPALQAWLLARLPRDAASLAEAAARLDRAALAGGGRPTRALARGVLADLPGAAFDGDDETMSEGAASSPAGPALL